ncbi:MAG TPA: S1 RNA-binding domain-containing protein [Tepidisphaeraceae bacterium]|jgi:small subunit ribosomal protein S1|nr:S1 RNA-binding domain-containing protein [Tepidisphaeraceae bacterium]
MSPDKDQYKEKFRPDADSTLDRELSDALGDLSLEKLYGFDKPQARPGESTEQLAAKGLRRGKIVSIGKDDVFVDMGGKSQGIASLTQFENVPTVGEEMEFHVERYDPREGLLILTRRGAVATNITWDNLEIGQIVEGTVTGMNKGGLELQIKNMRAFMPAGQVDLVFQKDISTFIGQRMTIEVTQFDRAARNLIVSRRNILEREKEEARQKMLAELTEGQVRRGSVTSVMDYGAFVDIGGVDGLLHISEMSHRRVRNPAEVVKVGDVVDVMVVKIDQETGKIGLSLKQAMADPWTDAATKYPVGTVLTGRVTKVEGFGAFLEAEEGMEGLLPVSEISWQRIKHPADVLKEGDTVKLVVIALDPVARRMTFSIKQAGGDPWAGAADRFPLHSVVNGKVTRVAEFGAFVEIEPGLEGLVHVSELAAHRVKTPGDVVKSGQEVRVRVLELDKEKRRIALSIRRAEEPAVATAAAGAPAAVEPAKKKKRPQLRGGLDL